MDKVQSEVGTKTSAKGAVSEAAAPLVSEILEGAQADFAGAQEAPKGKGKGKGKDKDKEEKKARYVDDLYCCRISCMQMDCASLKSTES